MTTLLCVLKSWLNTDGIDLILEHSKFSLFAHAFGVPYLPWELRHTDLSKQCWPRLDATECSFWSGSACFATHPAEYIKMPCPLLIFSQSVSLILIVDIRKFTYWMANSADPNQLAVSEANWSGSTLFAKAGYIWVQQASVTQLDVSSDWIPGGRGFNPRWGQQHSFMEIDHEIFSTVILSLVLIQEGQLSVSGKRMCTILVNRLED